MHATSFQKDDEKKYVQLSEGYSSHVYCEGLDTDEADEGCRILEST